MTTTRICMLCHQPLTSCTCGPDRTETVIRNIAASLDRFQRLCRPGAHSFPGGSFYCQYCGITRDQLKTSFAQ